MLQLRAPYSDRGFGQLFSIDTPTSISVVCVKPGQTLQADILEHRQEQIKAEEVKLRQMQMQVGAPTGHNVFHAPMLSPRATHGMVNVFIVCV